MRHVVDVEVVFSDVTADPLEIHMSRSSPGRYALHEFAKNVFERADHATAPDGR